MKHAWIFLAATLAISLVIILLVAWGVIPPFLFIVIFLPFVFTGYRRNSVEHYALRICPQCSAVLKGTENYCPICGFKLRFKYER